MLPLRIPRATDCPCSHTASPCPFHALDASYVLPRPTVLVGLYEEPEKPGNPIEFIKKCLGAPSDTDVESLKAENEDLKRQMDQLTKKNEELKRELEAKINEQQ